MATGDKPDGGRPEIPDLDLGAPRAPAPRGKPSGAAWPAAPAAKPSGAAWPEANVPAPTISGLHPRAANVAAPLESPAIGANPNAQDYFGSANFDGDHFGGDDGFLSLDTSEPMDLPKGFSSFPPPSGFGAAAAPKPASISSASPPLSNGPRRDDRRVWPTGVTPPTENIQIERAELLEVAAYGPVPGLAVLSPLYSFRVIGQRRALRAAIRGLLDEFVGAERARDKLLADLARDFRSEMPDGSPTAKLYALVSEKEQRAREEQGAVAGANGEYQRGVSAIEVEVAETRRALTEIRSTLANRQTAFVEAEEKKNRAEAKKKRLYIELSGIVAQAEKAGGKIPQEHLATVSRLEGAIASQKPELERLERQFAETKAAFSVVRDEERRLMDQGRGSDRKRRALDAEFEQKIGLRTEGAYAAERATETALADVGRALLAARTPMGELELNFFTALERADSDVAQAARAVEKHVRALDVYDESVYKRGLVLAAAAVLALVVLLVLGLR
jgi:hypothetical protein